MLIDTHSHIYLEQFSDDLEEVISRAKGEGLNKIFLPNIDSSTFDSMNKLCVNHPGFCYPMSGLHPCSVNESTVENELGRVRHELNQEKYIAVGEIGIDLYWDKTTLEVQKMAFKQQIEWSLELDLPFVIHARDSFDEIFQVMDEFDGTQLKGVFHCFTGNLEQLKKILESYPQFYLGLGGVSTFKNSGMNLVIPHIPLEKIVLETDAPYLAPVPKRGKRNEPSYLSYIAQCVADFKEMSLERLSESTTKNAKNLFKIK